MPPPAPPPPAPPPPRAAVPPHPPAATPRAKAPGLRLASVAAEALPPRILFNGLEKFGKTTTAAFAPGVALLESRGETGYETLFSAGLAPDRPFGLIESWPALLAQVEALVADPAGIRWLALDALGGFERLCAEHVCDTQFGGRIGEDGFGSYGKGLARTADAWCLLLQALDRLRARHRVGILILGHLRIKAFNDPLGPAYDRYESDCDQRIYGLTHKWADALLYGLFEADVRGHKGGDISKGKGKAVGGGLRVVHAQQTGAVAAGNRYGMPPAITLSADPADNWAAIEAALPAVCLPGAALGTTTTTTTTITEGA